MPDTAERPRGPRSEAERRKRTVPSRDPDNRIGAGWKVPRTGRLESLPYIPRVTCRFPSAFVGYGVGSWAGVDEHGPARTAADPSCRSVSPGFPLISTYFHVFPHFWKIFFSDPSRRGAGDGSVLLGQSASPDRFRPVCAALCRIRLIKRRSKFKSLNDGTVRRLPTGDTAPTSDLGALHSGYRCLWV